MNSIVAERQRSRYVPEPHLVLVIDGLPLDSRVAKAAGDDVKGLVPTLLDWLEDDSEQRTVWDRILPKNGETTIAPVLMCPDDLDLVCTTVVAEARTTRNEVRWDRLGLLLDILKDNGDDTGPNVDWFDDIGPFVFDREQYGAALDCFKRIAT